MHGFRFDEPPPELRNLERMEYYEAVWGTVPNGSGQNIVALFRPRVEDEWGRDCKENKNKWGPPVSIALLGALRSAVKRQDLLLPKDMDEVKRNLGFALRNHNLALAS